MKVITVKGTRTSIEYSSTDIRRSKGYTVTVTPAVRYHKFNIKVKKRKQDMNKLTKKYKVVH